MKPTKEYTKFNELSSEDKNLAFAHVRTLGYRKYSEISRLEFCIVDGKVTGVLDRYELSSTFSI